MLLFRGMAKTVKHYWILISHSMAHENNFHSSCNTIHYNVAKVPEVKCNECTQVAARATVYSNNEKSQLQRYK